MAVQITGRQIANAAVGVSKLDLSTGTFDFTGAVLQVATPAEGDAANRVASKGYVDGVAQGLDIKESCKVATTGNITLSGTQTIDGVAVSASDRVLVKDQTDQKDNGIYVCAAGSWARAADFAGGSSEAGAFTFVEQGTVNGDNGFVCTSDKGSDVVGTNNIIFSQFSGAGQITAGSGLTKTGNTLNVAVDDSSIEISSDALQVKAGGISNAMLAGNITAAKLAGSIPSDKLNLGNGVQDNGGNLQVKLDGSTLALSSSGIKVADAAITSTQLAADSVVSAKIADGAIDSAAYIADSVITSAKLAGSIANAKLANSTISGVALGGNLNALTAGNGISMSSYNGSAAVSDLTIDLDGSSLAVGSDGLKIADGGVVAAMLAGSIPSDKLNLGNGVQDNGGNLQVKLDGSTLALSSSGLKVADAAIGSTQIAADAITNAKIADGAIGTENLNYESVFQSFDANGSTLKFDLSHAVPLDFKELFVVTVNGLVMEYKDTPDAQDNYKIANDGTGSVGAVTFGANLANGDRVTVRFFKNK